MILEGLANNTGDRGRGVDNDEFGFRAGAVDEGSNSGDLFEVGSGRG